MKTICIYCGSSDKLHTDYLDVAYEVGTLLAGRGLTLVFGAGKTGLMGALADGVLDNGGEVVGVIPRQFYTPALVHTALTRLEVVEDMHTRKARMAELADGFIALPGGFGTFEEFFEILTWAQVGLHQKPVGLLNLRHYFDPLLALVENARREGFIYPEHQSLFLHSEQPEALLEAMERFTPPPGLARWVDRDG